MISKMKAGRSKNKRVSATAFWGISTLIIAAFLVTPVHASHMQKFPTVNFSSTNITDEEIKIVRSSFTNPGMLPTNPFYFLKRFGEDLTLMLAPQQQKAHLYAERAATRLAETKKLIEQNLTEQAERTAEDFAEEMRHIDNKTEMNEMLKKSAIALELVSQRVPEQAQPAIERAIGNAGQIRQRLEGVRERMRERMRPPAFNGTPEPEDNSQPPMPPNALRAVTMEQHFEKNETGGK
jgi:hypothetical protein